MLCSLAMILLPLTTEAAAQETIPKIPGKGQYTIGGESQSATDFYIYIENATSKSSSGGSSSGGSSSGGSSSKNDSAEEEEVTGNPTLLPQTDGLLPQTGDYGPDKNSFLIAALVCGFGYLFCDHYEKKRENH
jgi:hypothetical protein